MKLSRELMKTRAFAAAALALAGLPLGLAGAMLWEAPAQSAPARAQIGGTWDLAWQNSRGATRRGRLIIEQRGAQLDARLLEPESAVATGSISGSAFTLRGTRFGLPFTIVGRADGKTMTGTLSALGLERRFTGARRRR